MRIIKSIDKHGNIKLTLIKLVEGQKYFNWREKKDEHIITQDPMHHIKEFLGE